MIDPVQRSAEKVYEGIWLLLADWFRVPRYPPTLPVEPGAFIHSFHPSRKYLAYLKMYFWIGLVLIDVAIVVGWLILLVLQPAIAWISAIPVLLIAVVPDIIAYVVIHLRYDTMWYVMTDRSLRIRRGIWVIIEHTITFENVQDVYVYRGPIQQLFGISNIIVETAGAAEGEGENRFAVGNKAIMQGIDNPEEIRQMILERVRATRSAGLGDEPRDQQQLGWSQRHIEMLQSIRDEVQRLSPDG